MSDIFTRSALKDIMEDGSLTPGQRVEQVYGLFGRALGDGYVEKEAAARAQAEAVERARAEWAQGQEAPDVTRSEAYRALKGEFDAYRAMQQARTGADYAGVKPKFFETVYGMVDRAEGARPVAEQLAEIRRDFEEYFVNPSGPAGHLPLEGEARWRADASGWGADPSGWEARGGRSPAVVLPMGQPTAPGARMTLSEAMRRANAGERVDVGRIGGR